MKALVYHGPGQKAWEEVPAPSVVDDTDAIVRVDAVTIGGTDLHILKGDVPAVTDGRILGHEAVGTVEAVGAGMQRDRDRGPVAGRMPVHTAKGDDHSTRRRIGHPPEPALHLGAVRGQRVPERQVGARSPVGGDEPTRGARCGPPQPVRRAHRGHEPRITVMQRNAPCCSGGLS
jgi:NADPH:quinone reductase-like Zn-dependent oxidoreductase